MKTLVHIFARNLKRLMAEQGLNQTKLARKLGVEQPHIATYLKGQKAPTLTTVEKFARVLDIEPWKLLYDGTDAENDQMRILVMRAMEHDDPVLRAELTGLFLRILTEKKH
jgi:transcriptional regulator with XRE-family HTH domain